MGQSLPGRGPVVAAVLPNAEVNLDPKDYIAAD